MLDTYTIRQTEMPQEMRFLFDQYPRDSWEAHPGCAFRGSWAVISRDLGHAFHGIAGSHFMPSGRLANR